MDPRYDGRITLRTRTCIVATGAGRPQRLPADSAGFVGGVVGLEIHTTATAP